MTKQVVEADEFFDLDLGDVAFPSDDFERKRNLEGVVIAILVVMWALTLLPVYLSGAGWFSLPVSVLVTLAGSTLIHLAGILAVAAKYVFSETSR